MQEAKGISFADSVNNESPVVVERSRNAAAAHAQRSALPHFSCNSPLSTGEAPFVLDTRGRMLALVAALPLRCHRLDTG